MSTQTGGRHPEKKGGFPAYLQTADTQDRRKNGASRVRKSGVPVAAIRLDSVRDLLLVITTVASMMCNGTLARDVNRHTAVGAK